MATLRYHGDGYCLEDVNTKKTNTLSSHSNQAITAPTTSIHTMVRCCLYAGLNLDTVKLAPDASGPTSLPVNYEEQYRYAPGSGA